MAPIKKIDSKSDQSPQQQGSLDTWFMKKKKSSIPSSNSGRSSDDKKPATSTEHLQKYSLTETLVKKVSIGIGISIITFMHVQCSTSINQIVSCDAPCSQQTYFHLPDLTSLLFSPA